ncbi:MAG: TrkH family potassium uptake protein, partial [Eggerthellaceae bacterium]|nr:TrkH family potassium uptake protein [Eggerthellaceae bacterium]
MWRRFTWYDVRIIAHYSGALVLFMAAVLGLPLLTSLVMGEWDASFRYLLGILVSLAVGFGLRLLHVAPGKLTQVQAIAVTGLAWFILALVGSIPLALSHHFNTYLDALFDTLSAWTTTGASLAFDIDHMAYADHMWRFLMEFIGGQGVVVIALSVGIMGRTSSTSLYDSEGRSEHVLPGIMQTTRFIVRMAIGIVAIGAFILALVCFALGMSPHDAFFNGLWLAMASFDTGGLTPMSPGLVYYHSFLLEMIVVVLMLMGTINFALHSEIWHGRLEQFFKDIEVRASFVWVSVAVLALSASLAAAGTFSDAATMVRRGVFTVIAAFTTTGFQTISANQLTTLVSSGALLIIIFL